MIQAGDPESKTADSLAHLGAGGLGYTIPAEIEFPKLYHKRGALAAARQGDMVNPERKSSSCQFYIVQGEIFTDEQLDQMEMRLQYQLRMKEPFKYTEEQRLTYKTFGGTPHLDGQYAAFGKVIEGMDVVNEIAERLVDELVDHRNNVTVDDIKAFWDKYSVVKKNTSSDDTQVTPENPPQTDNSNTDSPSADVDGEDNVDVDNSGEDDVEIFPEDNTDGDVEIFPEEIPEEDNNSTDDFYTSVV